MKSLVKQILKHPDKISTLVKSKKNKINLGRVFEKEGDVLVYEIDDYTCLKKYEKYKKYNKIEGNDVGVDSLTLSTFASSVLSKYQIIKTYDSYFDEGVGYAVVDTIKYNLNHYVRLCKKQRSLDGFPLVLSVEKLVNILKQIYVVLYQLKESFNFSGNRVVSSNVIVFDESIDIHYRKIKVTSDFSLVIANLDFSEIGIGGKNFFRMNEANEYPVFTVDDGDSEYYKFQSWTSFSINKKPDIKTPLVWDYITFNVSLLLNPHIYYITKTNKILQMVLISSWIHPEDLTYFVKKIENNIKRKVEINYKTVVQALTSIRFKKDYHHKVINVLSNL